MSILNPGIRAGKATPASFLNTLHDFGPILADRAAAHDAQGSFVAESYADLKKAGFFVAAVPAELGGIGFCQSFGLERLLRDVHGAQFHPLPEKQQHLFTGRVALGLEPVAVTD